MFDLYLGMFDLGSGARMGRPCYLVISAMGNRVTAVTVAISSWIDECVEELVAAQRTMLRCSARTLGYLHERMRALGAIGHKNR
jgi:hypothetical protein